MNILNAVWLWSYANALIDSPGNSVDMQKNGPVCAADTPRLWGIPL